MSPASGSAGSPVRTRTFTVRIGDETFVVEVEPQDGRPAATAGAVRPTPEPAREATPPSAAPAGTTAGAIAALAPGESAVKAPMPGLIVRYVVREGDAVRRGEPVLVLEAMKMENPLPAPADGRVARLTRSAGDMVARGDVLAVIG